MVCGGGVVVGEGVADGGGMEGEVISVAEAVAGTAKVGPTEDSGAYSTSALDLICIWLIRILTRSISSESQG